MRQRGIARRQQFADEHPLVRKLDFDLMNQIPRPAPGEVQVGRQPRDVPLLLHARGPEHGAVLRASRGERVRESRPHLERVRRTRRAKSLAGVATETDVPLRDLGVLGPGTVPKRDWPTIYERYAEGILGGV